MAAKTLEKMVTTITMVSLMATTNAPLVMLAGLPDRQQIMIAMVAEMLVKIQMTTMMASKTPLTSAVKAYLVGFPHQ